MSHLAWAEIFYVWKIHEYFIASTISTKSQNTVFFETSSIYNVVHLFLEIFLGILLEKVDMLAPHLAYWPEITFYLLQRNWLIRDMCYMYTYCYSDYLITFYKALVCSFRLPNIVYIRFTYCTHFYTVITFYLLQSRCVFLQMTKYYTYHGYMLNTYWHSDYILPFTKNLSVL